MILRANEKNIEKDFLPYFMQSDDFHESSRANFRRLTFTNNQMENISHTGIHFARKDKQKELIEMFKTFDNTIQLLKQQKRTLKNLKQKLLNEILG